MEVSLVQKLAVFFSLFRSWIGCAYVGIAYGYARSGWVAATVVLVSLAFFSAYCAELLLRVKYKLRDDTQSYSDIAGKVLGFRGVQFVDFLSVFCQTGFLIAYVIFILSNIQDVYPLFDPHFTILLLIAIVAPLCLIQDVSLLGLLALLGSLLMFVGLGLCFRILDLNVAVGGVEKVRLEGLPSFIGLAASAVMGIPVVLPLEAAMFKQKNLPVVAVGGALPLTSQYFVKQLYRAVALAAFILVGFGYLASRAFGPDTESVITLNFPDSSTKSAIQALFVASLLLAFPMQFLVFRQIVEKYVMTEDLLKEHFVVNAWRASLCIIICVLGARLPHFGAIYSFVGAFGGNLLAFIFPLFFHLRIDGSRYRIHMGLLYASLVVMVLSTGVSVVEMIAKISMEHE